MYITTKLVTYSTRETYTLLEYEEDIDDVQEIKIGRWNDFVIAAGVRGKMTDLSEEEQKDIGSVRIYLKYY